MSISEQDYELLSAYLDDMLETSQRAELEARLNSDPELRGELNALRQTVQLIRSLPQLAAPRSYTLTPEQALKIRSERVRPAAEGRILRLVIPILSAAASMMLVLFGLALLLNNPNASISTQTAAMATMTQSADTGSVPLRSVGTPTVAATMSLIEGGVDQIMMATEADAEADADISLFDTQPESSTGAAGQNETAPADVGESSDDAAAEAPGMADEADEPDESDPANAEEQMSEEAEAQPLATFDSSVMRALDPENRLELPDELMDTFEVPSAAQTAERTATVTSSPTPTQTATATQTATPTVTVTAVTIPAPVTPDEVGGIAAVPPQMIGLILLGLGISLGIITLVMARRAGRIRGEAGD